jgi:NADH-quinone oxidoreductase subunit H
MGAWNYFVDMFARIRLDWVEFLQDHGLASSLIVFLDSLIGITLLLIFVFMTVIFMIWLERRFVGWLQLRYGPNRCGPFGLLQTFADAIKLMFKEFIMPAKTDKVVHWIAPVVLVFSAIMIFAVIPIGEARLGDLSMGALADLNVGILYIVAIASLGVFAIFMGGWSSDNKFALLGAMRAIAQLVSYEVPMILAIMGVVIVAGSMQLSNIVDAQYYPFILAQPLGFIIYLVGAIAELNRAPLDQVEAESELTTGYFTEYSGMKFGAFYLGEYINALAISAIVTTLFLSGWKGPGLPFWFWFILKVFIVFIFTMWMRFTLIRVRIDQIMAFAWKFLVPLALINIFVTAGEVLIWDRWMAGWEYFPWPFIFLNWAIAALLIVTWSRLFFKLGGGRVDVPTVRAGYREGYGAYPPAPVS